MVTPRLLDHIGDQLGGNGCPALVLLVLTCVREMGHDGGNPLRACDLASVDHDAQLHQGRVHCPAARIDDVDILFTHRFGDAHIRLPDTTSGDLCLAQGQSDAVREQGDPV